jgi:hypothetical protein
MKLLSQVHMLERAKLINFKGESMNYVDFRENNLLMKYKACNFEDEYFR